jgi:hypothetical protein
LETRRLRLYVVAYLRGLLKPYYEHGYSSLVREELILSAINVELDNETRKQIQLIEGMMAQHVKDKADHFQSLYDRVYDLREAFELAPHTKDIKERVEEEKIEALTKDPEVNRLIAKYKEMETSGKIKEFEQDFEERTADMPEHMDGFSPGEKLAYSTNPALERRFEIPDSDVITDDTYDG